MFPELGAFPDVFGVFGVLFDDGEDGGCYDAVSAGEVVVDFFEGFFSINGERRGQLRASMGRVGSLPWRVRVMDCSSFSNSSVSVKLRWDEVLTLDILNFWPDWQMYR